MINNRFFKSCFFYCSSDEADGAAAVDDVEEEAERMSSLISFRLAMSAAVSVSLCALNRVKQELQHKFFDVVVSFSVLVGAFVETLNKKIKSFFLQLYIRS